MWWDATLSSVSIESRGHSAKLNDWNIAFWLKKKKLLQWVFFYPVCVCKPVSRWGNITLKTDVNMWVLVWEGMPHGAGVSLEVNYIPHVSINHQIQLLGCFFNLCTPKESWLQEILKYRQHFFKTNNLCSRNCYQIGNMTPFMLSRLWSSLICVTWHVKGDLELLAVEF